MNVQRVPDMQVLLDSIESIVWEFDLNTNLFTMVSRQAERMLGYPIEQWTSEPDFWTKHMHPDDRAWAPAFCFAETTMRRGHEFDYRMIARDGRVVWLRDIVTVVADGNTPLYLRGVMVDITRGKEAEAERDRLLERERVARAEAEDALRIRDEFLSIASHELATPLTPLLLRIQALRRHLERHCDENPALAETLRGMASLERTAKHFRSLIEMLLDVSKIEAGVLTLQRDESDLVEIVRDVIDDFEGALRQAGSSVTLVAPAPVVGCWDRMRLLEVVSNLLSNAIKYAPGCGIDVVVERRDQTARFTIRDRGRGVSAADADRIFGKFERASSSRHFGGFGLGLYVAQRIAEAHGGKITVQGADGGGATFVVELPLSPSPPSPAPSRV